MYGSRIVTRVDRSIGPAIFDRLGSPVIYFSEFSAGQEVADVINSAQNVKSIGEKIEISRLRIAIWEDGGMI